MGDMHEDLAKAFDTVEKVSAPSGEVPETQAPDTVVPANPPIGEETPDQREARVRDEKGRFAKAAEKPDEKAPPAADKPPEPAKATPAEVKPPEPATAKPEAPAFAKEGARPPQSWKPAVREKFATLPPEVQEEVVRVDREVRKTMQDSAEARQNYQRFREVFAPAEPLLRAQNVDPVAFTSSAVQTAMALAAGTQAIKAQALVQLIKTYGVDIQALDAALTQSMGHAPPPGSPGVPVGPYQDPRVDELLRSIEQAKSLQARQLEERARAEIAKVENEEFFEDVRADMADLLDLAARRGVALTPQEAYRRATLLHPEVSKVLEQREAAKQAANPNGSTQRARAAAASVKGSPAGPDLNGQQERDLRGELEAAWDATQRAR
jgi:hypothetical protein